MKRKVCMNDVQVKIDQNSLSIQRDTGFFSLINTPLKGEFGKIRSLINYSIFPDKLKHVYIHVNNNILIEKLLKNKKILYPTTAMFSNADINDAAMITSDKVTAIVTAEIINPPATGENEYQKSGGKTLGPINTMVLVNKNLSQEALLNSFMVATEAKSAALWDLDLRSYLSEDLKTGGINDSLVIACTGEGEIKNYAELEDIQILIRKCVREATKKALKNGGFSKTVLDFIEGAGVRIEDLVESGMELCVGVEKSQYLYRKLYNQILKSLQDINVVSLVIAGIRLEEDYKKHRVHAIDVDDDPAFLYADEILGMAVANQIAGTKAIFNFKRYDEEKPGIIGEIGPIIDDIFAGIVAGCMSKIFEE